jgi:hypothetical protein
VENEHSSQVQSCANGHKVVLSVLSRVAVEHFSNKEVNVLREKVVPCVPPNYHDADHPCCGYLSVLCLRKCFDYRGKDVGDVVKVSDGAPNAKQVSKAHDEKQAGCCHVMHQHFEEIVLAFGDENVLNQITSMVT